MIFTKPYSKPDASSEAVMKVTKIVMCLVGVASMFIALFNTQSIVSILMFCFTLRAAGSFFPYVMGHYWKKASTAGTIASLLAGTVVVVYLEHISKGVLFGIKFSQPIIPGLVAAFIGFVVFSKLMPPKVETTELAREEDVKIQESAKGCRNCVIRVVGVERAKIIKKSSRKSWCKSQLFFVYNLR